MATDRGRFSTSRRVNDVSESVGGCPRLVSIVFVAAVLAVGPMAQAGMYSLRGFVFKQGGDLASYGIPAVYRNLTSGHRVDFSLGRGITPNKYWVSDSGATQWDTWYVAATEDSWWGKMQGEYTAPSPGGTQDAPDMYMNILFGDVDGNGVTSPLELSVVEEEFNSPGSRPEVLGSVDFDADGIVSPFEYQESVKAVPEPSTLFSLVCGMVGAAYIRRRDKGKD